MHYKEVKSILSASNGMNLYRGCSHGCIYCDARSTCYHMDHKFEDIEVKQNSIELLTDALRRKRNKCMIGTGAMSDPYMHIEKELLYTRRSLEVIDDYGFGVAIQTKSDLILRDLDLLKRIHRKSKCVVQMTLTTYDEDLCKILEPNVCTTKRRADVLNVLRDEGIPAVVWMTPILPFINDTKENIEGLLSYCYEAKVHGILTFGLGLTLRDGDREYFYQKLDQHFPGMKEKYIRTFGNSYDIYRKNAIELQELVTTGCKQHGMITGTNEVFSYLHTYEERDNHQMSLFDFM